MTAEPGGRRYLRFAALALAVTAVLIALGWIPTLRRSGAEALTALVAGCTVSLVAALVGGWVLHRADPESRMRGGPGGKPEAAQAAQIMVAGLQAMGVRLLVLLVLGVAVGVMDLVPVRAFLIWMAISYLALLPVETRFALIDEHGPKRGTRGTS